MQGSPGGPESGRPPNRLWAVGGGKGGTGKSLITVNLGLALAGLGHRVCLVDADLGAANLHSLLGLDPPRPTLSDLLERKAEDIHELVVPTEQPNLFLVSGARDPAEVANLKFAQKAKLLRHIQSLEFDYVLLDLGSGAGYNVVDFFLVADCGLLVTTPEPTAVEGAYRFLKSLFYRALLRSIRNESLRDLAEEALRGRRGRGIQSPADLLAAIEVQDPVQAVDLAAEVAAFRLLLIVNQVRTAGDAKLGPFMRSACLKYFGVPVEFVGSVAFDDKAWQSIRLRSPLLLQFPGSPAAQQIRAVGEALLAESEPAAEAVESRRSLAGA